MRNWIPAFWIHCHRTTEKYAILCNSEEHGIQRCAIIFHINIGTWVSCLWHKRKIYTSLLHYSDSNLPSSLKYTLLRLTDETYSCDIREYRDMQPTYPWSSPVLVSFFSCDAYSRRIIELNMVQLPMRQLTDLTNLRFISRHVASYFFWCFKSI